MWRKPREYEATTTDLGTSHAFFCRSARRSLGDGILPRERQGLTKRFFVSGSQVDERGALFSPLALDRQERLRVFTQVRALLIGPEADHAVQSIRVAERREDAVADTEVGMPEVGAFDGALERQRNSTESSRCHRTLRTLRTDH